jgi:hypothetical protein
MAKRAEALLARESLAPYVPPLTVAADWLRLKRPEPVSRGKPKPRRTSKAGASARSLDYVLRGSLRDPDLGVSVKLLMSHGELSCLAG